MKKNNLSHTVLFLCTVIVISSPMFVHHSARASTKLMGGKLIISGYLKETAFIRTAMLDREKRYHDSNLDFLMTAGLLEALYTLQDSPDLTVRLFGGVKYWWEKSHYFDQDYRRSIPHRDRKDWTHPRSFADDIITEAYVDIQKGPWQVKIGKQIVIWGQLNLERVADVVNPLDFRRGYPGINAWEDVKRGLWMIRVLYQSTLPGTLLFETIFNPGDYKNMQLLFEAAQPGSLAWNNRFFDPEHQKFGIYHWQREKWSRDAPGWSLKDNWELGFRVRGNTYGVDWTVLYWNARDDGPVAHPGRINDFTMPFITSGIRTAMQGKWVPPPDWPDYRVFYFKRYQTVGGTAQYYAQPLWDTVWRLEWFYEIGRPLNKGTGGDQGAIYSWTRRNILGIALQCAKTLEIPWFTKSRIGCNAMLDFDITYGWEKIFNHDHDLVTSDRGRHYRDSVNDVLTCFMRQSMCHGKFMFIFVGNYFLRTNKWQAIPILSYVFPGGHWRFDTGFAAHGGANREYAKSYYSSPSRDRVVLRLRYEF